MARAGFGLSRHLIDNLRGEDEIMASKGSPRKSKRQAARPVFDSIRKPGAPPGHPMSQARPDEIARPSGRKAKHKQRPETTGDDDV